MVYFSPTSSKGHWGSHNFKKLKKIANSKFSSRFSTCIKHGFSKILKAIQRKKHHEPKFILEFIHIGSKWHLTSQHVYFAFRTIVLFAVLLPKKTCFHKEEFSNEIFWNILFILFVVAPICYMFFYNQFF
jgi:hypothetical protein